VVVFLLFGIYITICRRIYFKITKTSLSSTSKEDEDSKGNSKKQSGVKKSSYCIISFCCSRNSNCKWNTGRFWGSCGQKLGLTELFIGVGSTIVGIVGNAAEHSSAITFPLRGKMNLALNVGIGFGTQLALFVVPLLVMFGIISGNHFTLNFTLFELINILLRILIIVYIFCDGIINWLEGVMVTVVYVIIAVGFFFLPA
jgi:calcium/proton exchanger cax